MRKKKYFLFIISLLIIISFISCKSENKNKDTQKDIEKTFDIKAAENIVNGYMGYLLKEDHENASKFYSKELVKSLPKINKGPLKIKGYNIDQINEIGKSGLFKIKVTTINATEPYTSLEEYTIKVIKEETDYKIGDISIMTEKESFIRNGKLRIRSKNNVDTNLLIDPSGIPNYAFTKDDKAKTNKIVVPKKNYGTMIFAYNGYSIAISTYDKNAFAGIIKIDESMSVQGGQKPGGMEGGQQEGGDGGAGGTEKGASGLVKEKPVGKEFTPLDLLKDCTIEYMTFSGDEKFILIQYKRNGQGKCIRVYNTESGEIIPYEFHKNYPIDKVDVIFSSFDKEVLNYEVLPRSASDKSVGEYIGRWQMSLKDFKVKKM
ncbi:hypothetical protein BD780_003660 [Clostridium tetanomorphum]|uniref:Head-tail adaptor protein n=1 Tax=Clostridium tetanomorphum TaxID=1553 RepID=A0A923J0Q5_CLOTT|nr:hypothetical protein [Clostridium tetanomorphum]KAJ50846.1 hypothetical protein CTM_15867 [Clostridium tetanomorphum DSM 665]MBC2398337.1 hypothetical protein [Clostridium tetanomorphum]MBP1865489.1 hypothetical protein [Clostridium tetanomorphum]NRS86435.1 hypothetical protein [Clostridium tetanomorphum]NRZ95536.1 hypothetical protein [Clostridium tetanomorphum]